jgi:hypothetical protein
MIFTIDEAKYFCQHSDYTHGNPQESINSYCKRALKSSNLVEGSAEFNEFRSNLLRYVERCLFLSTSNYYSTHRLLVAGHANWAHVTSYYSAFYSARALLGIFGVYLDAPYVLIDVEIGETGVQKMRIRKNNIAKDYLTSLTGGSRGSHNIFWETFYRVISPLHAYITDPVLRMALSPISGRNTWQIETRNDINYDVLKAVNLISDFDRGFKRKSFPLTIPGVLNTQFKLTETILLLTIKYAKDFNLNSDALHILSGKNTFSGKLGKFIVKAGRGVKVDNKTAQLLVS